ncbi:MAG: sigma 54-interacting transcriptional regulator [Pyrinomonadaceae bacterium]|nr:sigma 54-interacting transcriptional regulator [Pyrinomonadaceae bacterium]
MIRNEIDIVSKITAVTHDLKGIRTDSTAILQILNDEMSADLGFVCLRHPETGQIDVVAAVGMEAVTFRRLEARAAKSVLVRVMERSSPLFFSIENESTLGFFDDGSPRIISSVPIKLAGECIGSISLAFSEPKSISDRDIVLMLEITAALIAQLLRAERLEREESRKLVATNVHLKQELKEKYDFGNLVGNSSPMRQVQDQVTQIARSNVPVLLRGESGAGKELIANAIHYNSLRSKRPFIKVNCAALPETIIDGELFGYEKDAFGAAAKQKRGHFELADGGTLFLDEIGDLPLQTQAKVLRVIKEREFERLGDDETIPANVRLVASTNQAVEDAVAKGRFREDLFYALNVFTIFLPPLRERKADILLLAEHFVEKYGAEHNKHILRISTPAIDMLTAYHFPGNVRELENAIERAVLVCDSNVIHGHHLPPTLQTAEVSGTEMRVTLESAVAAFERDMIQDTLKSTRGNIAKAAMMLDSTERILGYKIKKYGVDPRRFKQ